MKIFGLHITTVKKQEALVSENEKKLKMCCTELTNLLHRNTILRIKNNRLRGKG